MKKLKSFASKPLNIYACLLLLLLLQTACVPFINSKMNSLKKDSGEPQNRKKQFAIKYDLTAPDGPIEKEVHELLLARNFSAIDKIAEQAKIKKERLIGGYWKLDTVYNALGSIYSDQDGLEITAELLKDRIALLKNWRETSPKSITARVALAIAYTEYGGFFRGGGYIDTVSDNDFAIFQEQLDLAEKELLEAQNLDEKCPRWYREILNLARAKRHMSFDQNKIYEEAVKSEPDYLQTYLVRSENLTPKWGAKSGEWQTFVIDLPDKLAAAGSDEADIIYFVVLVNKINDPSLNVNWGTFSKERIQKGFADLEKKYGVDNKRLNQFAYISTLLQNLPAARAAFERIGNKRDREVWGEKTFNMMKQIALSDGKNTRG